MKKKVALYSLVIISVLLVLVLNIESIKSYTKKLISAELRNAINKPEQFKIRFKISKTHGKTLSAVE